GVWERSPAGIAIALQNEGLMEDFRRALPDVTEEDIVGSPYCIRDYTVAAHLGGAEGLAAAREALAQRGLGLILHLVPNHVASRPTTRGRTRIPSISSRAATTTSSATRRRSSASATACSRTAAIRSSRRGPTWCS